MDNTTSKKVLKIQNSKKPRNRTPLSCSVCRSRKVKCDKNRPHCNSCIKTGYKHICHYLEPEWSKNGYEQLSHEKELTELKEKVRLLEEQLSKYNGNLSSIVNIKLEDNNEVLNERHISSYNDHIRNLPNNNDNEERFKKFKDDDILIAKRFESLHINPKNNSLSYLGSTHYLSILKGDPYLKILWGHVFKIREKLLEYHEYQRSYSLKQISKKNNGANYSNATNTDDKKLTCPVSEGNKKLYEKCPVSHVEKSNEALFKENFSTIGKCPIGHVNKNTSDPQHSKDFLNNEQKCPVEHPPQKKDIKIPELHNENEATKNIKQRTGRCPIDHKLLKKDRSLSPLTNNNDSETLNLCAEDFATKLNNSLPSPSTINNLINLFFKELYPDIPILNENLFKQETKRILQIDSFKESERKYSIVLKNAFEISHIGILLVILRLGFLNVTQDLNIDLKLGLSQDFIKQNLEFNLPAESISKLGNENPVGLKSVDYVGGSPKQTIDPFLIHNAHDLLAGLNFLDDNNNGSNYSTSIISSNLMHIHFLIFYKWYLGICPENDTINTLTNVNSADKKSELLLARIIQLSFDCGLHRDPDNFSNLTTSLLKKISDNYDFSDPDILKEPKLITKEIQQTIQVFKNQWRKTWFFIVDLDINQSLYNGTPRLLRKLGTFSDVKLPYTSQFSSENLAQGSNNTYGDAYSNESSSSISKKTFLKTVESLLYNQQFDYCFNNDLGEIIIGKNCKLFYQLDLILIAISELLLDSQIEVKCKKWKIDLVIEILMDLINDSGKGNTIELCIKKLLTNGLLDPLESYALVANGMDLITPSMCKSQSQKERFLKDSGYNLPSLTSIFKNNETLQHKYADESFGTALDGKKLIIPQENITKCLFFKKHLQLQMMLYTLNYILFTSYEPKLQNGSDSDLLMDLTTQYCQKTLKYSTELFKTSLLFFHNLNSNKIFKTQMKIVIIPYCLDVCYRSMQFMICLILRHKVGPLLKDLNNVFTRQIGGSTNTSDSESDNDGSRYKPSRTEFNEMLFKNEDMSLKEPYITELLLSRMELFHNLTRILAAKYKYSLKLSRSTGFFLTLLKPSSKNGRSSSIATTHSTGSISSNGKSSLCPVNSTDSMSSIAKLFKNIPSLIIQANGDQLSRCPVYQDNIGFQIKLPMLTMQPGYDRQAAPKPPTLPSLQYQPITSQIYRKVSDIRSTDEKNRVSVTPTTPITGTSTEPPIIQRNNLLETNILPLPQKPPIKADEIESFSSEDYVPDFEEFLKQVSFTPSTYNDQIPQNMQNMQNFSTTPDEIDLVDLNMLISPNSIMQASMNFLMPLEDLVQTENTIIHAKREDSNQSVWDLNEELIS